MTSPAVSFVAAHVTLEPGTMGDGGADEHRQGGGGCGECDSHQTPVPCRPASRPNRSTTQREISYGRVAHAVGGCTRLGTHAYLYRM